MRKFSNMLATLITTAGLILAGNAVCLADTLSVVPSVPTANVGETVVYNVVYTADDAGTVFQGNLGFDSSCLQLVGGNAVGQNPDGSYNVVFGGSENTKITFNVIGSGNGAVSINGTAVGYSATGEIISNTVSGGGAVSCVAPTAAPTPAPTEAPTPAPTPAPTEAPTPAPTEASTVAPTSASTAARTEAETANIVSQSEELRMAALEQGTSEESISEEQSSAEESTEAETDSTLKLAESLDGISIPSGAEQITYNYHGNAVQAAKTAEGLYLLPVLKDDGSVQWHVYNESNDTAIPYARFSNLDHFFVIIPADDDVEIPKEFVPVKISMENSELPAWRNPLINDENMYFVYAINELGEKNLYRFDGPEGMLVRYVQDVTMEETTEPTEETTDPEVAEQLSRYREQESIANSRYQALSQEYEQDMLYRALIIIGLGALALILLLVIAILASKLKSKKDDDDDDEEEEDVYYSDSGIRVKPRERTDRIAEEDTRQAGREEGTSPVRPAKRRSAVSDDADFARTSTTSEVKAAPSREKTAAATAAAVAEGERQEKRRPTEAPMRKSAANGEKRRSAGELPVKRSADGTPVRKKRPAGVQGTAEGVKKTRPAKKSADPSQKNPVTDNELWKETETGNLTVDLTEAGATATAANENMTESVKVVTRKKAVKPVVEDLFEDVADESGDFDITDFKNI